MAGLDTNGSIDSESESQRLCCRVCEVLMVKLWCICPAVMESGSSGAPITLTGGGWDTKRR